ncbi:hypothetical protein Dsin_021035 [Dipteronia sinensis]|uniref:Reverse transcriptase n=1 Tax=Dipteronia sinensis TaxID=43782 RepID=A0AAE0AB46_9ROSI|nr:hypothetical protein Dsin_021035 [Dipteronia sinensis]
MKRKKRKVGSMTIKLDMSKAYDRMEWGFIDQMMRRLGFSDAWVSRIMCLGVNVAVSEKLAATLGVRVVDCHEKYLGLPCYIGRDKRKLFTDIVDRIWSKLKGWQGKNLSIGGKNILLKSVVQAIPTYSMSLFQLPGGLVREIERLCARFWWGGNDRARELHWSAWSRLCDSKMTGGLGFRDLKVFNRALLAKQCWRILENPNSLVARILKANYFHDRSFLEAKKDATVQQLILPSDGWDVRLVTDNFTEEDRDAILRLLVGISRVEDTLMWHFELCGSSSVKSGYWLGRAMADLPRTSGLNGTDSWWKYLWRLPMALKIKMFIWRACYDWVPTRCNLVGRGMKIATDCPVCNQSMETTLHAVWGCRIFKDVCSFKLNTDTALNASSGVVGVGLVVRDSLGCVLATSSQRIVGPYIAQMAEAVAIHRGLVLACETGLYLVKVESDAKVVVDWINDAKHYSSEVGLVIDAIRAPKMKSNKSKEVFSVPMDTMEGE